MIRDIEITERAVILGGKTYGDVGAYEKIKGFVNFEFDPDNPANKAIVDLDKAPLNERGRVEARSNFYVLQAVNAEHRAGLAMVEVVNRGNKTLFNKLNRWVPKTEHVETNKKGSVRGGIPLEVGSMPHDPDSEDLFGDFWIMKKGFSVIWVGWEADIIPSEHQMYLQAPCAKGVKGIVRNLSLINEGQKAIPIGLWGHRPYEPVNPEDPNLTLIRQQPNTIDGDEEAVVVPRSEWMFAREEGGQIIPDPTYIYSEKGFAGGVYRLVYQAENPLILGLGFAAIRDTIAYAKYDDSCPFPVDYGISIGRSQTGRFQLDYLYSGINADEQGRKALDGVMPHTGGAGRGSFNVRFGQPTTGCNHFAQTLYPVDMFPFTAEVQTDPYTGRRAGLYDKTENPEHLPKVFHVNTGWEYWARANSLLHTAITGERDSPEAPHERHYYFSCTQHSVEMTPFPPEENTRLPDSLIYRGNFQDYHFALRALVIRLFEWIKEGKEPPASRVPTYKQNSIVHPRDMEFPSIRHMGPPAEAAFYQAWVMDYGPRFVDEGIIDNEPPVRSGKAYPSFVSTVDEYGNEVAGIPTLELLAPLATYTPWRRWDYPNSFTTMTDYFTGAVIPLPRNNSEKSLFDDPRPSIETLYGSRERYLASANDAAAILVNDGFLLEEDIDGAVNLQGQIWDWIMQRPAY